MPFHFCNRALDVRLGLFRINRRLEGAQVARRTLSDVVRFATIEKPQIQDKKSARKQHGNEKHVDADHHQHRSEIARKTGGVGILGQERAQQRIEKHKKRGGWNTHPPPRLQSIDQPLPADRRTYL
jgi:hypothetical protein